MKCRVCNNPLEHIFVSLGSSPLSNSYLTEAQLSGMEPHYPLEVYVCDKCFLVQLEEFENPSNIFSSEYAYFSSYSDSWLKHCKDYAEEMVRRFGLGGESFVMEIASNDGYLLQYFKDYHVKILGVEPASNTAEAAIKKGIPTDITFFNADYAKKMVERDTRADLIIGNNVLAHNPDLNGFVEGLKIALKAHGLITMEFPHLMKLVDEVQFDTIYHEHFSYFSFTAVDNLFSMQGLSIFDVRELPTHGGSLRIYAKHANDATKIVSERVDELRRREDRLGYRDIEFYRAFGEKVKSTKRNILEFLIGIKNEGKTIVGYGAPAKGNTLLNYCGIRTDFLEYTVDRSPHKQGRYLPGTRVPIKAPETILQTKPDYVIILPWNLKEEIMQQMAVIREWGGKFICPIPEISVL
jgi:hypothetical protein